VKNFIPFNLKINELALLSVSAVLLACSFESLGLDFFVWFALVPLLITIEDKSPREAFRLGFVTGILFYLLTIYWLVYTVSFYGKINLLLSVFVFFLLVLYLAAFFGLFALLHCHLKKRFDTIFVAPVIWVALEYLKTYLFSGFPWILLGYSIYKRPLLTQFSDITGVYGQSFLIVLINLALYRLYRYFKVGRKRRYVTELAITLIIFVAAISYGVRTMRTPIIDYARPIKVGLTQGNIDQDLKWDKSHKKVTMDTYFALTDEAIKEINETYPENGATLIVWPETATPFYMQTQTDYRGELLKLAGRTGAYLLTGGLAFDVKSDQQGDSDYDLYNSAFLLSSKEEIIGRYDKVHLVPFGEYVPLSKILFFVNKLTQGIGDFTSGKTAKPLTMDDDNIRLGTLICYESIFPNLVRSFAKNGADVLVNITNDAWFGDTSAPYQQISMAVLRAVENKRYLIRAANTGITTIIDPFGRTLKATGIFKKAYLTGKVYTVTKKTFYSEHGDIFSQLVSAILALLLLLSFRKKLA
jgi:apolipoprotein N-acyltransferase